MQEHRSPRTHRGRSPLEQSARQPARRRKAIIAIIETEAWKALGYKSFAEAWNKEMDGVTIAAATQAHVIYQLLTEGLTRSRSPTPSRESASRNS